MKTLNGLEILEVWERGVGLPPAAAIIQLLVAAYPEIGIERIPRLTVGERDALLLNLQQWLFGPLLEGVANCPKCQESLQFSVAVNDLRVTNAPIAIETLAQAGLHTVEWDDYQVEFRLPTAADAMNPTSLEKLLELCIQKATKAGDVTPINELPAPVVEAISRQMALADPQADIQLALTCPACQHHWSAALDVPSFLWDQINRWAQRTFVEVHQLASAYGWSEKEILSLSPTRRQIYLSLLGVT